MQQKITTIALCDDLAIARTVNEVSLNYALGNNYKVVISAVNGQDLIDKLAIAEQLPEIILLDINMPVLNGYQALNIIRSKYAEQKVLIISGHRNNYTIVRCIVNGANGFLSKHAVWKEIYLAINQKCGNGTYFPDGLNSLLNSGKEELNNIYPEITNQETQYLQLLYTLQDNALIAVEMDIPTSEVQVIEDSLCKKFDYAQPHMLGILAVHVGLIKNMEIFAA